MVVFADRVKETTLTVGVDAISLLGTSNGYTSFVGSVGDGNSCHYAIIQEDSGEWEVGIGTVTESPVNTLSRDTVFESSNAGQLVNFNSGIKDVFLTVSAKFMAHVLDNVFGLIQATNLIKTQNVFAKAIIKSNI